jgi:hypothetical protein
MADVYNNASLPHGTTDVVIPTGGVTYIVDQIDITDPSDKLENRNGNNEPDGFVLSPGFVTGTMTIQLPTAATAVPSAGDEFVYDFQGNASTPFVVSEVGEPRSIGQLRKVSLSFDKTYN